MEVQDITEGSQGYYDKQNRPVFSAEDPLVPIVTKKIQERPERVKELRRLFSTDLRSAKKDIVAIRSEDLLTFLNFLLEGKMTLERPKGQRSMSKKEGWFYMNALFGNEYFDQHPRLRGSRKPSPFMEQVAENSRLYLDQAKIIGPFMRCVLPILPEGWEQKAHMIAERYLDTDTDKVDRDYADLMEAMLHSITGNIESIVGKNISPEQTLSPQYKNRLGALQDWVSLLRSEDRIPVIRFLSEIMEERGGIIIGFNRNILRGTVQTDAMGGVTDVIHGEDEIAVSPPKGILDLTDSIAAIEPQGEYEDEMLKKLGIL